MFCAISPSAAPLIVTSLPPSFSSPSLSPSYSPFIFFPQAVCFKVDAPLMLEAQRSCWINGTSLNSILEA